MSKQSKTNNEYSGLGDWIGTFSQSNRFRKWMPFEDARDFVRNLGLKSSREWREYISTGKKPSNIPSNPNQIYKEFQGIGDWLGSNTVQTQSRVYLSFFEARKFVRKLNLKSNQQWREYLKSGKKPSNIPSALPGRYKNKGWKGWSDFLGHSNRYRRDVEYLNFLEARKYVRGLGIGSTKQWQEYCRSDKKPANIPKDIYKYYSNDNRWKSFQDFFAYKVKTTSKKEYLSFEEARNYVRSLNLISKRQWFMYFQSVKCPAHIPKGADEIYRNRGWISWYDYLGVNPGSSEKYLSYSEAKSYVSNLGIKTSYDWASYYKDGKLPHNIPKKPNRTYKNIGWIDWFDFLGTDGSRRGKEFVSFNKAKKFFIDNNIKTSLEWISFQKIEGRPSFIPSNLQTTYKGKGWRGWKDFLERK